MRGIATYGMAQGRPELREGVARASQGGTHRLNKVFYHPNLQKNAWRHTPNELALQHAMSSVPTNFNKQGPRSRIGR